MGRGFRRPLRRRIERFNHQVFSRFSPSKSGKINSRRAAREAATRIYIATRSLRKLLPLILPAAFPHRAVISRLLKFRRGIFPRPSSQPTFRPQNRRHVKLEICARTSHSVDLASQMMIV